jgi:hypothetical protein
MLRAQFGCRIALQHGVLKAGELARENRLELSGLIFIQERNA